MFEQYSDSLARLYPEFTEGKTNVDGGGKNSLRFLTRSVTFQVTDNCNLACFVAGTKILMSDYTYKNIEDIQVGDEVIGFDEHTEKGKQLKLVPTKVTHTFVRHDETMRVTTKDGNSVVCTKEHPFLTNNYEWKRAIDIQAQDNLFICVDKDCLNTEVRELQYYGLYERVYNFETDTHTYVANNFLVHNCSYCYQINKGKRKMSFEVAKKYVDLLLSGDKGFKEYGITPELSKGIITEFIGGEPFLEVELIDDICDYMYTRMTPTSVPTSVMAPGALDFHIR